MSASPSRHTMDMSIPEKKRMHPGSHQRTKKKALDELYGAPSEIKDERPLQRWEFFALPK